MRILMLCALVSFFPLSTHATCSEFLAAFKPILFSIEQNGERSYVMGVFHQTVSSEEIPSTVKNAIDQTRVFVNEVDQTEPFPNELLFGNEELSSLISNEAFVELQKYFPNVPKNVRPFLPYVKLMETLMVRALGQTSPDQKLMDVYLKDYAVQRGKEISHLDSQQNVVRRYAESVTPQLLNWTLLSLSPETLAESFIKQRDAFIAGDPDRHATLYRKLHRDTHSEALFQSLITEPNKQWLPMIRKLHTNGPAFFAVGVGHLSGPGGLLDLLSEQGFNVNRVL